MNNLDYNKFKEIMELHDRYYKRREELDAVGADILDDGILDDTLRSLFYTAFPQLKDKTVGFELGGYINNLTIYPLDAYDVFQWMWDENGYRENMDVIYQELDMTDGVLYQEDIIEYLEERNKNYDPDCYERVNEEELEKLPRRENNGY